jgi:uncharacterized protein
LFNILNGARQSQIAMNACPRPIPCIEIDSSACLTARQIWLRALKLCYNKLLKSLVLSGEPSCCLEDSWEKECVMQANSVSDQDSMPSDQFIPLLMNRLRQLDLSKVILFGSHAYGAPSDTSDIDLLVVLDSDEYPQTYKEKSDLYLQVSRTIRDIREKVSVDLIVHTRSMHKKFIELDSMFAREISQKGVALYEADH